MRELILLRGLPGSGKTTIAQFIEGRKVCADDCWAWDYTTDPRGFTVDELRRAHLRCRTKVKNWMTEGAPKIIVHNTLTTEKELSDYEALAKEHGYRVHRLVVEGHHGSPSVHNVPEEVMLRMKDRFEISL